MANRSARRMPRAGALAGWGTSSGRWQSPGNRKNRPRGAPRSRAPASRLRSSSAFTTSRGPAGSASDRARDECAVRCKARRRAANRPARPSRGKLHRARRPRARRARTRTRCSSLRADAKSPAFKAQAAIAWRSCRCGRGEFKAAQASASAALKLARQCRQVPLEAMSLFRLARSAVSRQIHHRGCGTQRHARRSALRDDRRSGRAGSCAVGGRHGAAATWGASPKRGRRRRRRWRSAAAAATCTASAMRTTSSATTYPDIAANLKVLSQSLASFEAAGYVERQGGGHPQPGGPVRRARPVSPRKAARRQGSKTLPAGRRQRGRGQSSSRPSSSWRWGISRRRGAFASDS